MVENNNIMLSSEKEKTVDVNFEEARRKILELLAKSDKKEVEKELGNIIAEYPFLSKEQVSDLYSIVADYDMKVNLEVEGEGIKPIDRDLEKIENIVNDGYSEDKVKDLREVLLDKEITKEERAGLFNVIVNNENAQAFIDGLIKMQYDKLCEERLAVVQQIIKGEKIANENDEDSKLFNELCKYNYYLTQKGMLSEETEMKQKQTTSVSKKDDLGPRPATAEIGEVKPSEGKSFFEKMAENRADKKEQRALSKARGWDEVNLDHIKSVDFNKYPYLMTAGCDFTKIDHAVLPDPKQNPIIILEGSKLKGKVDLSAYDKVGLLGADLSQVTELDLSHCKDVDLRGVDLSHVKKLKLPQNADRVLLDNTKFPPMDELDLSMYGECHLDGTDMSAVNKLIAPRHCFATGTTKFSQQIDASNSYTLNINECDLTGVMSIKTPRLSDEHGHSQFWMHKCKAPDLKELDVSSCEDVLIGDCDLPNLEKMKIRNTIRDFGTFMGNNVPNLGKVETMTSFSSRETRDGDMFETFSNICRAVSLGQHVYKNAETGELSRITENQIKTVKFIEEHSPRDDFSDKGGISHVWDTMKKAQGHLYSAKSSLLLEEQDFTVLTEYNKLIAQGMGLSCYVDMNTCRCVDTPKLKENQSIEFPPITFNSNGSVKDVTNHYNRIKGIETASKSGTSMHKSTENDGM